MDKIDYYFEHYREEKENVYAMEYFLKNFKPISENAVIQSMTFEKSDEERVCQTKKHDKLEHLALNFRERLEQENREYYEANLQKYLSLKADMDFFEQAIERLDWELRQLVKDLVCKSMTWDEIIYKHNMARGTVSRKRKKAIEMIRNYFKLMGKDITLKSHFDKK